jgi:hypothetical protein
MAWSAGSDPDQLIAFALKDDWFFAGTHDAPKA